MKNLSSYIWYIPAGLLFLAILPMPYGYYMFLRLVVTFSALLIAWHSYKEYGFGVISTYAFIGAALLFNPVIPVGFSREDWAVIDAGVAIGFIVHRLDLNKSIHRLR